MTSRNHSRNDLDAKNTLSWRVPNTGHTHPRESYEVSTLTPRESHSHSHGHGRVTEFDGTAKNTDNIDHVGVVKKFNEDEASLPSERRVKRRDFDKGTHNAYRVLLMILMLAKYDMYY